MRRGDQDAASTMWAATTPRLMAVARGVLGHTLAGGECAEDAVQRAFISILKIENTTFKKIKDPYAWLVVTVRNEAKMIVRGTTRRRQREADRVVSSSESSFRFPTHHAQGELEQALSQLSDADREVIILKHLGGLTFQAIGEAFGISKSGAALRYSKAIKTLRSHYERPDRSSPRDTQVPYDDGRASHA